jgi:hypothetical protein
MTTAVPATGVARTVAGVSGAMTTAVPATGVARTAAGVSGAMTTAVPATGVSKPALNLPQPLTGDSVAADVPAVAGKHRTHGIGVSGESESGIGVYGKGGAYAGYFEGNVQIDGNLQVGACSLNKNNMIISGGPQNYYTLGLDANESKMSFAHPDDGHYTITLDGRNGNLNLGGDLNVGNNLQVGACSLNKNNIGIYGGPQNYWTLGLDANESKMSFAHPDDGHYTIILDGRNTQLAVGNVLLDGAVGDVILQNADCAEDFEVSTIEQIDAGTVMALNDVGQLEQGKHPYDKRVAGVVSGAGDLKPGLILGRRPGHINRLPIALMGRVHCKVDADFEPIDVGDLLTTSATPGHAMKACDPAKSFGAVIGKALAPLKSGRGFIPILVALQ